jgi:uncharacterized protein YjdB
VVASIGNGTLAHADTALLVVETGALTLSIDPILAEITLGDTLQLEASLATPSGASVQGVAVQWATSNDDIAPITSDGVVTSLTPGDVVITATANGMTAIAYARVLPNPVASVSVSPANSGLYPGQSVQLTATVRDSRGRPMRNVDVAWSSSDAAVASVNGEGRVLARSRGTTIVTASLGPHRASATINVFGVPAGSVVVTAPSSSVPRGGRVQATATALDGEGNPLAGKAVAWSSSNPSVAQVDASGMITGLVVGNTTIYAIIDSKIGSLPIAVVNASATSMSVVPGSASITLGRTAQLSVELRDQAGNVLPASATQWSSANPAIAAVNGSGLVTAVGSGSTDIIAQSSGLTARSSITVIQASIASISLSPSALQLQVGGSQQLQATVRDAGGNLVSNAAVSWSSSNPGVASVSATGLASAVGAGSAVITATSSGVSSAASVSVANPPPAAVSSVQVTFNSPSLMVGQSTQAMATAYDSQGNVLAGRSVTWISSDVPLATVSSSGLVTAIASGSATIVAKIDGIVGIATLSINAPAALPVHSVQLSVAPSSIQTGQTASSSVVLRDSLGNTLTGRTVAWSSNKPAVASIGLGGVVTGVGAGSATITAASGGVSGNAPVSVTGTTISVATVTVSAAATTLTPGQSTQATATLRDAAGNLVSGQTVTWVSSNPAAATVSPSGGITAVAVGATTIIASAGGASGSVVITVTAPATASVSVTAPQTSLTVGQTVQAVATVRDASGSTIAGATAFWSSSNAAVATVSQSGVITGVAAGSANITASNSGKSGSVAIAVTAPPTSPPPPPPSGSVPSAAPALPQATVDVSWPSSSRTLYVNAGGNLQAALDSAKRGDEIVLQAGATFTGNFELKTKPGTTANGWITVRSSAMNQLPPLGGRVNPALHAVHMPKIVTPNVLPAVATAWAQSNISGWRLVGLEILVAPGAALQPQVQQGIVVIGTSGSTQVTAAQTPREIILDRVYIHGQSNTNTKRCLSANGAVIAVIGSQLLECHGKGFDSQAILAWNGPGPFLIENNRLEAAGEVIMFGGDLASIPNLVGSDITIRRNHLTRPMSWQGVWTVKNLFELKNAQRVLFEQNVLENHWVDAQAGSSIVLGTADNPCSWCIVSDVTFQWNHIHNVAGGFNLFPNYGNAQPMRRVKIMHNLVTGLGAAGLGSNGRFLTVQNNVDDVWFEHNTGMGVTTYVDLTGTLKKARFTFRNNVGGGATYNWFSSQGSGDAANSANLSSPYLVANNGFVAAATALLPSGSLRTGALSTAGFVNATWPNGDWSLTAISPFAGLGVDYVTLQAKLVNVR